MKIHKLLFLVLILALPLSAQTQKYYIKNGKKIYLNPNNKQIKLYKVRSKATNKIEKIYVKELFVENENIKETNKNFSQIFVRADFRFFDSTRQKKLSTKSTTPQMLIEFDNKFVKTDGTNYTKKTSQKAMSYGFFTGVQNYGHYIEAGAILGKDQRMFELALGLMLNQFTFHISDTPWMPVLRLGINANYEDFKSFDPTSIGGETSFGLMIGSDKFKIEPQFFYQTNFYEEKIGNYSSLDEKESKLGLLIGLKYIFD